MNLDLREFVKINKEKNFLELQYIIDKELSSLKRIKLTNDNRYDIEQYSTILHEFTVFLDSGIPTTNINKFAIFIPIVKHLVRLKDIPESRLSILI